MKDFEVTQTWKWNPIKSHEIKTYQFCLLDYQPALIHIIKSSSKDLYLVVWEDYELMGKTEILNKKNIKDKFNIEL